MPTLAADDYEQLRQPTDHVGGYGWFAGADP